MKFSKPELLLMKIHNNKSNKIDYFLTTTTRFMQIEVGKQIIPVKSFRVAYYKYDDVKKKNMLIRSDSMQYLPLIEYLLKLSKSFKQKV